MKGGDTRNSENFLYSAERRDCPGDGLSES